MGQPERGYREERPLADLIPPDRRKQRAVVLFLAGAGSAIGLTIVGVVWWIKITQPPPPPPTASVLVGELSVPNVMEDHVGAAAPGPLANDARIDQAFDVEVTGDVVALALVTTNLEGTPDNMHEWATSADVPVPRGMNDRPAVLWQLAVQDLGHGPRSEPNGELIPLGPGRHHLRIYASDAGSFHPDHWFRLYALHRDGTSGSSPVLRFTGDGPPRPEPPPPPKPTLAAPVGVLPFDRGAAAAALGGVSLATCKALPGDAGSGHVKVTFANDGTISSATVDNGPHVGTPRGGCVAAQFRTAKVPPFDGAPVRVGKSYSLDAP